MKAKVLMLTLLGAFALSFGAQAQQEVSTSQNLSGHKTIYNRDGSRWFIDIQGGAVMLPLGEANNKAEFMDRVSLGMPMLGIGAWHNPYFGTRLQLYGWRAYGFEFADAQKKDLNKYGNFFAGANFQFLFDLVNYFAPFKEDRVFHFSPFVGVGANYLLQVTEGDKFAPAIEGNDYLHGKNFDFMAPFGIAMNAGIQMRFRLHRVVDLNIEAQAIASKNNFRGTNAANYSGADVMALLTAGLSFNLCGSYFTEIVPMDWGLVNDLNSQINSLRAENAELSKRPASCPECPEAPAATEGTKTTKAHYSNVFFRINSAKIDANQMPNVKMIAKYVIESGATVYLTGYADAKTGTADYNMALSERRVNSVRKALEKNGVDASKIVTSFKGSSEQPYEVNKMNRVVIATDAE